MPRPRVRRSVVVFAAALAVLTAACGSDADTTSAGGPTPGAGDAVDDGASTGGGTSISPLGRWLLTSLSVEGAPVDVPDEVSFDLEIEAGGIGGLAGCNQFGGGLELGPGDGFAATELFLTEMACEPITLLDFESVYVGALAAADTWEVTPTGLLLTGNDVELRYDPAPATAPTPLEGTRWIFDTVFSGAGVERAASTPALDRAEVTLRIEAETAVVAADDCGEVSLALAHEGGADGNVAPGAAPAPPCEADASNLPEALDGIVAATGFMITDNRLTFIGTDGETVGFRAG